MVLNLAYNKNKLYKTFKILTQRNAEFDFFKKDLRLVFPPDFASDFSRKIFLMPDCFYFLRSGCEVINFEIDLIFLPGQRIKTKS